MEPLRAIGNSLKPSLARVSECSVSHWVHDIDLQFLNYAAQLDGIEKPLAVKC
jgi:hypothetical protein